MDQRRELFVDDHVVEHRHQVDLCLQRPVTREVVLVHDEPWEGNTCAYHTVFQDGDIYRMYYRGSHFDRESGKQTHPEFACYAESRDGIHWEKPHLGIVAFNGNKRNNILLDQTGTHNFTPFRDINPGCAPDARYKAFGVGRGDQAGRLLAFKSEDSIHWSLMRQEAVITQGAFDSQNLGFWDGVRQEYRAYFRDGRDGFRDIKTCTSSDFLNWSEPVWLEYPGAPREHLYTNQIQPYFRAPHLFVGFPARFVPDHGSLTEGLFMTSRDGRTFHRWGEAVIPPGQNRDKWHNRSNYIWWGLVTTTSDLPGASDELSLYTNERYYMGPGVKIRRYTYRMDGFVSARAGLNGGELLTKPILVNSGSLSLNFSTSAAGSVRVEAQDIDSNPLPGLSLSESPEIFGDEIEHTVVWSDDATLESLKGTRVRLRFELRDADLFAFSL